MVALSDILTVVRSDVLRDDGSTQKWSDAQLTRFVNDAIRALWPHVYVHATDTSTVSAQTAGISTYTDTEYSLPAAVKPYHRPRTGNLIAVEIGPLGGSRISDSLAFTDRYVTVRGNPGLGKAWSVDWGRRVLKLLQAPPYDQAGTYQTTIRLRYVRPVATLSASTDTYEGPDDSIPVLEEHVRYVAMRNLMRSALSDAERLQGLGSTSKQALDVKQLCSQYGCRMVWPQVER